MSNMKHSINNLPVVVREDGIIDVAHNSWNITSVEAEFDRAMREQGDFERSHPLESAVQNMLHQWKHNRFSSCCDYGFWLKNAQEKPMWEQIKAAIEPQGLPVTWAAWKIVEANYTWKLRHQWMQEDRHVQHFKNQPWYTQYQGLVKENHPVLRGEWQG